MSEILICTMGLSPGVVTRITQYLQNNEDEEDKTKRKRREFSEVWVVRTSDQKIGLLFNDIVVREFKEGGIIQGGLTPQEKVLPPSDTTDPQQVQTFADEFFNFLASKVTADGPIVHLCLSGGRKSMTYAATMGFVKLVAGLGRQVVKDKLVLWHIQLPSEEEAFARDYENLRKEYICARDITGNEVSQANRKRLLYSKQAQIVVMPFLYLGELGFDRPEWIAPE